MPAKLRAVEPATEVEEAAPDLSYEYRERNHIMGRDWAKVLVIADRGPPLMLSDTRKRTWWK